MHKDVKKIGGGIHKAAKAPMKMMKRKKGSISPSPEVAEKAMGDA
jgi:hypothetical protein